MKSVSVARNGLGHFMGFGALILVLALVFSAPYTFADVAGPAPEGRECLVTSDHHHNDSDDNHHGPGEDAGHGLPDCDVRDVTKPRAFPDEEQQDAINQLAEAGVTVRWDEIFGTPRMIINYGGFLTEEDDRNAEDIALNFVAQNPQLFKVEPDVVILGEFGATINQQVGPDRPFIVGHTYNSPNNASHVFLEQRRAGLRVFGSVLNFTLDPEGRILLMGAQYDRNGTPPGAFDSGREAAAAAVLLAAAAAGVEDADQFVLGDSTQEGQVHQFENPFGPETMLEPLPITAEPVVFPMPFGMDNHWAWLVIIQVDFDEVYEIAIDAATGDLLYRKNQVHAEGPQGTVFTGQNPCQGGDVNTCNLLSPTIVPFTGWVDPAPNQTTRGNNAIVVHNPLGNDTNEDGPSEVDQHFDYIYTDAIRTGPNPGTDINTDMNFVVTQAFYYVNMLHERYYDLGFDEAAGNFQQDNFGNGGAGGDPVRVFVDWGFSADPQLCCNASMWTPADGTSPVLRLRVGLAPGNLNMHRAMNGDTVAHEWAHGLSNRLVGGGNLGGGAQAGAMGEGWSDAVATSLWNDPVYGEYNNGNTATGIRGVSYANNTLTYGDLCSGGCQVHTDGRIWATALWDLRTALRAKHGANTGTTTHEQLMVDGMKNTPTAPSYLDARDGILAADVLNYGGANQCLIWVAFANRGMGFSASSVSNGSNVTAAEDAHPDCDPTADANGPYVTNEGTPVALNGAGSTAGVHASAAPIVSYEWDLNNNGNFNDAVGPTPNFTLVGQDGIYTISLRVTNGVGLTDEHSTTVTVLNVLPTIDELTSDAPVDENTPVTVSGVISDPGWLDVITATINWGDGFTPVQNIVGVLNSVPLVGVTFTFDVSHTYGDTGVFTATVCAEDDANVPVCETIDLQIDNVDPTAEIDKTGMVLINGVPTVLGTIGEPVDFTGRATDPGSDDLTLEWDWDDGSTTSTGYLVNPPMVDPPLSPTIQPRDVTEHIQHTFGDACWYTVRFWAQDDDGGKSEEDSVDVIIAGDADRARSQGYWSHQLNQRGRTDIDVPTLLCYLSITGFMSQVFHEDVDVATIALALNVISPQGPQGDMRRILDIQLLAAWLNFANGAIGYDEMVDTTGNGVADTSFAQAVETAETVRLNPASTRAQLEAQKNILERINLRDGG